jgi:hypothetical protein
MSEAKKDDRLLSVFASERREDTIAMIIAFILAAIVVVFFK